ncbi:hypothetical protein QJS10_CPB18g00540 [Acorus calamus]|uniref:Photosystem II core complex proteins psbY, chloroplastic n=1 Tax=Acorus calamus TaxID=4465 RepID=A0AAV9CL90_ACOCL|nr:hypothetical protein QJS10_CPB18g00540 [Acorus calamus]
MATMATTTMAMLNLKCMTNHPTPSKLSPPPKLLLQPQTLTPSKTSTTPSPPQLLTGTALAGAVFSALTACDPALASSTITDIAEAAGSDNRGLALLLPLIPALGWVLYNILQPALNQLNRMRSEKALVVGLGIGSVLAAAGMAAPPEASAAAEAAGSDSRGLLLLFVIAPAVAWVLYNILQPALNQINRMRS